MSLLFAAGNSDCWLESLEGIQCWKRWSRLQTGHTFGPRLIWVAQKRENSFHGNVGTRKNPTCFFQISRIKSKTPCSWLKTICSQPVSQISSCIQFGVVRRRKAKAQAKACPPQSAASVKASVECWTSFGALAEQLFKWSLEEVVTGVITCYNVVKTWSNNAINHPWLGVPFSYHL